MIANSSWIPLLASTAILLTIAASSALIALFLSLKKEIGALEREVSANREVSGKFDEIENQIEQIRTQVGELEQRRSPAADWSSEPGSLNLTRRGQVLRLHRRGEPAAQIASALGLSQGEVRLIVKVHELTRQNAKPEKSGPEPLVGRRIFDRDTRGRK